MSKENVLFSVIGVLLGFIVGFMFANTVNQRGAGTPHVHADEAGAAAVSAGSPSGNLPPDHPSLSSNGVASQQGVPPEIQAAIERAKNEPGSFEAQMEAAQLYYQINRFDQALEFLERANKLRPDNYDAVVWLGNVNYDAGRYETAERWYAAALAKNPTDINVRTDLGLTFLLREPSDVDRAIAEFRRSLERNPRHEQTLQNMAVALVRKGNTAEAEATLAKLAEVSPGNPALPQLRSDLERSRPVAK